MIKTVKKAYNKNDITFLWLRFYFYLVFTLKFETKKQK